MLAIVFCAHHQGLFRSLDLFSNLFTLPQFPYFPDYDYRGLSSTEAWRTWPLFTRLASLLRLGATPNVTRKSQNILVRLLLLPWWFVKYLLQRIAIRFLQGFVWLGDLIFPYDQPKRLSDKPKAA